MGRSVESRCSCLASESEGGGEQTGLSLELANEAKQALDSWADSAPSLLVTRIEMAQGEMAERRFNACLAAHNITALDSWSLERFPVQAKASSE